MTLDEFYSVLTQMGLPIAYRAFEEDEINPPELPYLIYYEDGKDTFYADNQAYYLNQRVSIELYTAIKDPELENRLEDLLRENVSGISDPIEYFWEDERLHEILYEVVL